MRLVTAALMLVAVTPAVAEETKFPVSIPQECVELAQREGVPVVMTSRYQVAKAKLKLARLSGRDPLVQQCRAAVKRQTAAMQHAH